MLYDQITSSKPVENISIALCGISLVLSFAYFWKRWRILSAYRRFPSKRLDLEWMLRAILGIYPKNVPFTSFLFQTLVKTVNEFLKEGICVVWLFKPYVFIYNEKYMKSLVNEVDIADKGFAFGTNKLLLGNGLVASEHESWKVHRKLLNPAFSLGVLKGKMHGLNKHARQLANSLESLVDHPEGDAHYLLKYHVCLNMGDFVFGIHFDDGKHGFKAENYMNIIESLGKQVIEKVSRPWLKWDFMLPLFPSGRKYLKIVDDVNHRMREVMEEMKKRNIESDKTRLDDDSRVYNCIGDMLMKLHLQDHEFTEKDVRDQLVTFATGAYATISTSTLWCFYTLGHHPRVQEKAYRELQSVVPDGDVTYEDLAKLKYLDCVVKETMRLYTTGPIYERRAREDVHCGPYTIPKGSEIGVFSFIMHRDPNVFPDPQKFDPERFSDSSKVRPWMYIPFFEGYRSCIGKKFAIMEIKINLIHVLRRFRITSLNKINDSDLDWTITMLPTKPLRFSFANRQINS